MVEGNCLCGHVCYRVARRIERAYQCHCSLCRKQGSAATNLATLVDAADFEWLAGESGVTRYRRESGFSSNFCASCGTTVPNALRASSWMWIPLGGLDGELAPHTVVHLYTESRASWDDTVIACEAFATMPDLDAFARLLGL